MSSRFSNGWENTSMQNLLILGNVHVGDLLRKFSIKKTFTNYQHTHVLHLYSVVQYSDICKSHIINSEQCKVPDEFKSYSNYLNVCITVLPHARIKIHIHTYTHTQIDSHTCHESLCQHSNLSAALIHHTALSSWNQTTLMLITCHNTRVSTIRTM